MNDIDTNNEQKEGSQLDTECNDCPWRGSLHDLLSNHLEECTLTKSPLFSLNLKIKNLEKEKEALEATVSRLQRENEALRRKNSKLDGDRVDQSLLVNGLLTNHVDDILALLSIQKQIIAVDQFSVELPSHSSCNEDPLHHPLSM